MLSAEQLVAANLFGTVEVVRDGRRVLEPAYGRRAVEGLLRVGYIQEDALMEWVMNDAGMSQKAREMFTRSKVLVRHTETDGRLELIPNIPGVTDDNLSTYTASEPDYLGYGGEVLDDRPLKYKLHALFTDVTVTDKLCISSRRMQLAKRLALSDPAGAATTLTEYIRAHGYPNAVVQAGDYAKSLSRMKQIIRDYAQTIVYADTAAPALVTPEGLRMSFDGFVPGEKHWTVVGPIKYALEVEAVYQLAIRYGPEHTMFLLGMETAMLYIQIQNDVTEEYYTGELEGYSSLDGIYAIGATMPSELTADQQSRMLSVGSKLSPVVVDGRVIGTAVHVTDRHSIMSEHTLTDTADVDAVATMDAEALYDWRSVGNDVAMVKRAAAKSAQWVLRPAELGERVVLCYSVGEVVEYSEVLRVLSVTKEHIILSDSTILRKGASGAAAVSLRDSALLGVFTTKRHATVVCSIFDSSSFQKVDDFESLLSSEHPGTPGVTAGNLTYMRMERRGFLGFLEAINEAVAPLYVERSGSRVTSGVIANVGGSWCTTVDPDVAQLVLDGGVPLRFAACGDGKFVAVDPPQLLKTLPNVRVAMPGERVFLFTRDGNDVAMTSVRCVVHCYSDDKGFTVEDFGQNDVLLGGALVIAERDCAVLGQYQSRGLGAYGDVVTNCVSMAVQLHKVKPSLDLSAVVNEVQRVFAGGVGLVAEYQNLSRLALELTGRRHAYCSRTTMSIGAEQALSAWSVGHMRIIEDMGFKNTDWHHFVGLSQRDVADVFLGCYFITDPGGWFAQVRIPLTDVVMDHTPVTGEFPFSRPSSVVSTTSHVTVADVSRLQDLESKYEDLRRQMETALAQR